jgi:hypothetical protein
MILFAREVLDQSPGATIVSEVKCSQRLYDDIAARGGNGIMWKVGHSPIKAKMRESGAALGGEMSGHVFFADRYFGYDDAIYAACRLLEVYVDHALVHLDKRLWRQMMANALAFADTPLGAGYRELDRKLAEQVGNLLGALQAKGRLARRIDCADAGQALFFICNQLFMEFVADDAMPRSRMKERMFRQVKQVFDGLLP